jgi:DNA-binding MarR family transcriptional regulator
MGTKGKGKDMASTAFELGEFLPYRMLVVTSKVTQVFAERYKREFGITIPESRILNVLGRRSPLSSWEICEQTTLNKTRVSVALNSLVGAGLVDRATHETDQRQLQLSLTRKGEALRQKMVAAALQMEQQVIASFGPADRKAFMNLLDRIEQDVLRAGG